MASIDTLSPIIIITAFTVGFLKGGFRGGVGLSLIPLLSVFFPPKTILGLIAPMLTLGDIAIIKYYWGKWEREHFKLILPSMVIGILLGSAILSWVSEEYLRRIIGLFTFVFVIYQGSSILKEDVRLKVQPSTLKGLMGGAFSGISSAIVHSGGVIVVIYLVGYGVAKEAIVAILSFWDPKLGPVKGGPALLSRCVHRRLCRLSSKQIGTHKDLLSHIVGCRPNYQYQTPYILSQNAKANPF
jgi:uncharacterized membrane protein YfcA